MLYFCLICTNPAASRATICGIRNIITIAIRIVVASSILSVSAANSVAAGAAAACSVLFVEFIILLDFCCLLFSYTGMNDEVMAPSASMALKR